MQRNSYIDARLTDWAQWRLSDGDYRGINYVEREVDCPRSHLEYSPDQFEACLEMDMAIATLPVELKETVVASYTWQGGVSVVIAKLRVTRATVHRRLCHADIRLDDYITQRQARAREIERRI